MIGWIKDRIHQGIDRIGDLIDAVRSVFVTLWSLLGRVFQLIRRGWQHLYPALRWFGDAVGDLAEWVYKAVRGLLLHVIPHMIKVVVDKLRKWAAIAIGAVRNLARGLFRTLRDWASKAINAVKHFLNQVWDWTFKHVSDLITWVARIGNKVADLVLHPEKLWAWLLPHAVRPLLKFLVSVGAKIGRWMLEQSIRAALGAAGLIESIIVKIL